MTKLLPLLLLLTACVTPQEREASLRQECINMGAPEGTARYYNCRKQLMLIQAYREDQAEAEYARGRREFENNMTLSSGLKH